MESNQLVGFVATMIELSLFSGYSESASLLLHGIVAMASTCSIGLDKIVT